MKASILRFASWYLNYGVADYDASTQRRMRITNAFVLYVAIVALPYPFLYLLYDFNSLWPIGLYVLAGICIGFVAPLLLNATREYAVAWLFTLIWFPGISLLTYGLSTTAGVHLIYFTFTAVWTAMFGIERWRSILALTAAAIAAFF